MTVAPIDLARQWLESSPFVAHLGMKLVTLQPDRVRIELPFKSELVTIANVVHGGAIGSLIDTAAAAAAWSGASEVPGAKGTTISLAVSFTSAARETSLAAEATVTRRGKSICFIDVVVSDPKGEAVARGLVTYKLG